MKNEKQKDRAHRQKMDDARPVEIAEEHGEGLELHRLPNRKTRQDRDNAG